MSDAQKLIREVLDEHQFNWGSSGTSCSGKACRDWRGYPMQHRQHLAEEIDKALGGLTLEFASGQILPGDADYTITDGSRGSSRSNAEKCLYFPRFKLIKHWVSGWTEVQS